jgi:glucuronosyltransferase
LVIYNFFQDLKTYLDSSKKGVVYVSFGSNVNPATVDKEFLDEFINAFKALPYDILWKIDGENLSLPKNVRIGKWFPQQDLLSNAFY